MRFYVGIALGALLGLAALEMVLRLLPVNHLARLEPTSSAKPFTRSVPHQPYVYSHGWAMLNPQHGFINGTGFPNSASTSERDGILVVGDSFVEALMLSYRETVQGRLEANFPHKVQAMGASGNGLADFLELVKHFAPEVRPGVVVILIQPSIMSGLQSEPAPGHSGFVVVNGNVSVGHNPYTESPYKALILHSALARYVYYNLKFPGWVASRIAPRGEGARNDESGERPMETLVLDYWCSQLKLLGALHGFRVVLLVDGDRQAIYSDNAVRSWNDDDRRLLLKVAGSHSLDVVDMQPILKRHWDEMKERMDYLPADGHWNPVAHQLAADQITGLLRGLQH